MNVPHNKGGPGQSFTRCRCCCCSLACLRTHSRCRRRQQTLPWNPDPRPGLELASSKEIFRSLLVTDHGNRKQAALALPYHIILAKPDCATARQAVRAPDMQQSREICRPDCILPIFSLRPQPVYPRNLAPSRPLPAALPPSCRRSIRGRKTKTCFPARFLLLAPLRFVAWIALASSPPSTTTALASIRSC